MIIIITMMMTMIMINCSSSQVPAWKTDFFSSNSLQRQRTRGTPQPTSTPRQGWPPGRRAPFRWNARVNISMNTTRGAISWHREDSVASRLTACQPAEHRGGHKLLVAPLLPLGQEEECWDWISSRAAQAGGPSQLGVWRVGGGKSSR